MIAKVRTL
jgi:hypothetical protein